MSRYATRPTRRSGVGWPRATKLAMLQILRLAPSMSPDIEPVVSSAKTISTRGRASCFVAGVGVGVGAGGGGSATFATGGAGGALGPAAPTVLRWAASAATPASTAPTIKLALTQRSRLVSLVIFMMASSRGRRRIMHTRDL